MPSWAPCRGIGRNRRPGSGREEFLDHLGSALVLDAEEVLALRRAIVPVDERLPALEEDHEERRSGLPVALRSQPLPELRAFVHFRDRFDIRLRPFDEGLQTFRVLHFPGGRPSLCGSAREDTQSQNRNCDPRSRRHTLPLLRNPPVSRVPALKRQRRPKHCPPVSRTPAPWPRARRGLPAPARPPGTRCPTRCPSPPGWRTRRRCPC